MTIKNILVSYNGLPSSDAALGIALLMARKYDAHLTGILSHGPSRMAVALGPWVTSDLMDTIRVSEGDRRREIEADFRRRTQQGEQERPGKTHWVDLGGDPDESLMEAARCYDIIVMGQYESSTETAHLVPHPDLVALYGGRPVLMVPKDYSTERLGDRAVLAWDGGRAAARAMADAMTILENKTVVTIVTVGEVDVARRREGRDVVAHLARHGIMTDWKEVPGHRGGAGRAILDMCDEKDAGLLVMGAYEHSRLAEELIGGATRSILQEAKVPVLLSH